VGGISAAIHHKNVWNGVTKGAVSGALAGAVVDLTIATAGTGTLALVAAGALSGAAGNAVDQGLSIMDGSRKHFSLKQLGASTVLGGALGYGGAKLAPILMNSGVGKWLGLNPGTVEPEAVENISEDAFTQASTNASSQPATSATSNNAASSIRKGALQKLYEHGTRNNRLASTGLRRDELAARGYELVRQNLGQLQNGNNTIIANVNGVSTSVTAVVRNGEVMSINMYPNTSITPRVSQGNVINLGNVNW